MRKVLPGVFLILFSLSGYFCFAQNDYATIIENVATSLNAGVNVSGLNNAVTAYMNSQNPNGSFSDITYPSGAAGDIPFRTHLDRITRMAQAYTISGGTYYGDSSLHNRISLALQYWNGNIHNANNWWYDQIAYPQSLGKTMILLRGGNVPVSIADSTGVMNYLMTRDNPSTATGANRTDEALHRLFRGALRGSNNDVSSAVEYTGSTLDLVSSGQVGINRDYSFLQHDAQLMTQTYGSVLVSGIYRMVNYLLGTSYSLSSQRMNIAFNFLHYSYYGAARGRWLDFSLMGRGVSNSIGTVIQSKYLLDAMNVDPAHHDELYDDWLRVTGAQPADYMVSPPYHVHQWVGDYTLHKRPDYSFSVRSVSTRTLRTESINGNNTRGTFLTDGATNIRIAGNEYSDIFPVWDWCMIPGITMRRMSSTPRNTSGVKGKESFVGGVSDSTYGVSANTLNSGYYNVSGKKAWFFFPDEVVCLGSGIASTSSESVATCVNQCLLDGSVVVNSGGTVSTLAAQSQTSYSGNLQWALQDSVGYFFPSGGDVIVSNKSQTGSWRVIDDGGSTTSITKDVFKMWFNHGVAPTSASYAYVVVPNLTSAAQMAAYNQSNIKILANTTSLQVVKHEGLKVLQAVFRAAGGGTITDSSSGIKILVDKGCLLLVKNVDSPRVSISIADPTQKLTAINVAITFPGDTTAIIKTITLPTGNYKGSSLAFTMSATDTLPAPGTAVAIMNGNWSSPGTWQGNVVPTGSSVVTVPSGITVTVASAITRNAGSTLTVNGKLVVSAVLTANGTVEVNGGTVQVNQGGLASTTSNATHFSYDEDATLVFNNTAATAVADANLFWGSTSPATAPRNVIISGTGSFGIYGSGKRTVSNLLKITSPITLTTSGNSSNSSVGSFLVTGTFEVSAAVVIGARLTCSGVCQLDAGGSLTSGNTIAATGHPATAITSLTYDSASTLTYNGGTKTAGMEWTAGSGGYPAYVKIIAGAVVTGASSSRTCKGDFTIDPGATFKLNGANGHLNVGGNWTNNGSFIPNTSVVGFNGTVAQSLMGVTDFYNLTLNNSAGLTIQDSISVSGSLVLDSGNLTLGDNNLFVASAGGITGGSASGYVVTNGAGKLKIGNIGNTSGSVLFPVGYSASAYTPLSFANAGTADNFSVNVQSPVTTVSVNNINKVIPVLWQVSEDVAGGSSATISFQWNAADAAAAPGFSTGSDNVIGSYTGGAWQKQPVTISGAGPYNASNTTAYTTLSSFAVGMDAGFDGEGIYIATANGNWSSPGTWLGNVVPSAGSDVTIPEGVTVTVSGALTRNAGSTLIVNGKLTLSAVLTANGAVLVKGGSVQVNQAGLASGTTNGNHFIYDEDATLIYNNTTATVIADANLIWGSTSGSTSPRNVILSGTGSFGIYGSGKRTVSNLLKITTPITLTTSGNSSDTTVGYFRITGTLEVASTVNIGARIICSGICQIDAGGSLTSGYTIAAPGHPATAITSLTYDSASTLIYNGVTKTAGMEWTSGTGGYPAYVKIKNGAVVTGASSARACVRDFTIDPGATFTLNGANGHLNIGGNWTNHGSFISNTSTVGFNGTGAQSLVGVTGFYNLTLNNNAELIIQDSISVDNNLALSNGKLIMGDNNVFVTSAGGITGASSSGYMVTNGVGQLKIGSIGTAGGSVLFPVGYSTSAYTPLSLANAGTTDNFSVNVQSPVSSVSVNDISQVIPVLWQVSEEVAGGSSVMITFQWNAADAAGAAGFSIGSNNVIGNYIAGAWEKQVVTIGGSGPYSAANTTAYTTLSSFAVGMETGFGENDPLLDRAPAGKGLPVTNASVLSGDTAKEPAIIIESSLSVFPNPSSGQRIIAQLENFKPGKAVFVLLDRDGKDILQKHILVTLKKQQVAFDLSKEATGIYFMSVINEDGVHTAKVVIHR